jgi:NAD(P)-dependent dehydrogenase (short-subunit alcohol dehydrogenase family)
MKNERKVAVVTGASQGIGAGLVRGFLERGYRVVANSRSIKSDSSADVLTVAGDIADPVVADRVIGDAVLYLESAPFVTGETLHVDGGAHAGRW